MINFLLLIIITIISYIITKFYYKHDEKYKCSLYTNFIGYLISSIIVAFILYLQNQKIITPKNKYVYYFSYIIIFGSMNMFFYHLNYTIESNN